jgi:CBS domain-containing protein
LTAGATPDDLDKIEQKEVAMLVQQILTTKSVGEVFTLAPSATLSEAAALLSEKRIGAIIVSKDGKRPAGILSERDIVRELGKRGVTCMTDSVDKVMTSKLIGCVKSDSADDVMQKMTDGRFRHMPVMEGEEMIGLISIGDVVKARLSELAMEKDALEGMIKGF